MFLEKYDKLKDFLRGAFYFFIAIFPFILYKGYLFHGTSTKSINTILFVEILAIIIGVFLLKNKKSKLSFITSPISISLLFLLIILTISSISGVDFSSSFWSKATRSTGIFYFIHIAFLYVFLWIAFGDGKHIKKLIHVFVISSAVFSLAAILGQEGLGWFFKSKPWQGLTIGNSTFAGMYMYAAFMMSAYLLIDSFKNDNIRYKKWNFLPPIIIFFNPYTFNFDLFRGESGLFDGIKSLIGSAQASSITLYISAIILIVFGLILTIKNKDVKNKVFTGIVLLGFLTVIWGSLSLISSGSKVQELYLNQSSAARTVVWDLSKKAIKEKPLFGWGVDNFDRAYQKFYNNRVLQKDVGGEAWFDRAHNILIDQTVESGYVGTVTYLVVYLIAFLCLIFVVLKSTQRSEKLLAVFLIVYFLGHILELQTAFDTTVSYVPLIIFICITAILFNNTKNNYSNNIVLSDRLSRIFTLGLVVWSLVFFIMATLPIMKSEGVNGAIRRVGSSEKRVALYPKLFDSPIDLPTFLWTTSNDIQRGVSFDPSVLERPEDKNALSEEVFVIIDAYESYIKDNPDNARLLLNLADFYIYQRLFEVDNLDNAHLVLDRVIELMPESPQPYWMKSVAYLYQGRFQDAKEMSEKAYLINPNIEESLRLKEYINKSIKNFPEIGLYSFRQI